MRGRSRRRGYGRAARRGVGEAMWDGFGWVVERTIGRLFRWLD